MNAKENLASIKKNIVNSEVAVKIIKNSSWLVGDKVFTIKQLKISLLLAEVT